MLSQSGYKWLGYNEHLKDLIYKYKNIFISIGHIKNPAKRVFYYNESKKHHLVVIDVEEMGIIQIIVMLKNMLMGII